MRTLAAVMAIFGYLDVPLVYMSTRWWRTQHPGPVFLGGPGSGVDASMLAALRGNIAGWLMWGLLVAAMRYRGALRQQELGDAATEALLGPPPLHNTAILPDGERA